MASHDTATCAALKLCAILLVLSWLQTVAATPRYIEPEHQQRAASYGAELQTRSSSSSGNGGRRPASLNDVNISEALGRFRFGGSADAQRGQRSEQEDDVTASRLSSESQDGAVPQLADIALVVGIGGEIHAVRRDTGLWVWSVHDANPLEQRDDVLRTPLVKSSSGGQSANITTDEAEDEEVYIIEPHSAGDIYVYHKPTGKMQRLPLSVAQLVDMSPFTFPIESADGDGRLFVGRKETKLVGVDLQTGKLVGVFGPEAGWCEWQTLRKSGSSGRQPNIARAAALVEDPDEDSIENRPWDLLYLGRTDYHISIYSKSQGLLQTLQYTSYGPSSLATAAGSTSSSSLPLTEEASWAQSSAKDGRYIQPMHDGSLVCFQAGTDGLQWTNHFTQPVIAVYDIVYPPSSDRSGTATRPQPLLYPHPSQEVHSGLAGLARLPAATFVGRTETSDGQLEYFAMSNAHYPLVAFAPASTLDASDRNHIPDNDDNTSQKGKGRRMDGIIGSHRIEESLDTGKTIDPAPESPLSIDPPPQNEGSSPHRERQFPARTVGDTASTWNSFSLQATLLLVASLALSLLYLRKYLKRPQSQGRVRPGRALDGSGAVKSVEGSTTKSRLPREDTEIIQLAAGDRIFSRLNGHRISPSTEKALPALPVDRAIESAVENAREDADASDKDDEGFEGSGDGKDANGHTELAGKNPKKGRRRRRGKRGGSGQTGPDYAEQGDEKVVTPPAGAGEEIALNRNHALSSVPEVIDIAPKEAGKVGSLSISEDIIGYGSQGTVVLKGTFQGRAVAVKRLLKDFVTVASHEVQLLQESDSHNNVIRYFYKEQHENFLYIALELCPASLFELIDTPDKFPDLVRAFDPIKAMKQITKGLQHLHKLKIIHRDLKPQNILIAASPGKPSRSQPNPQQSIRMVISDFGLCKKLDLDESSFLQSTRGGGHHAAGSFGYRAPEVLRGEVDANDLVNNATEGLAGQGESHTSSSTASTSTVAPARSSSNSTGEPGGGRKLTRSIDIFSLGCIFYFVLTMGDHPFGSRYEREINILNDKITLDGLSVMTENVYEAQELIRAMCSGDPHARPTAAEVTLDPLFWTPAQALHFLCDASDRFEIMDREALAVVDLEEKAAQIVGTDWLRNGLDRNLVDNLGKYRKYDGGSVRDLLRVLRNKKHHYQDLPENVRKSLGEPPEGFLSYFTRRFPKLVLHVHAVVKTYMADERLFGPYFEQTDDA